jgi:hypothetical protein
MVRRIIVAEADTEKRAAQTEERNDEINIEIFGSSHCDVRDTGDGVGTKDGEVRIERREAELLL